MDKTFTVVGVDGGWPKRDAGALNLGNMAKTWNDILRSFHFISRITEMWILKGAMLVLIY